MAYAEQALRTGRQEYGGDVTPTDAVSAPLTAEIMERLNSNIGIATEVRSRLYGLRDRMFGPAAPAADPVAQGASKEPFGFADAVGQRGRVLRDILNDIDSLSNEIAGRF